MVLAENYGELHDRLAIQGATLLIEAIEQMAAGTATENRRMHLE